MKKKPKILITKSRLDKSDNRDHAQKINHKIDRNPDYVIVSSNSIIWENFIITTVAINPKETK